MYFTDEDKKAQNIDSNYKTFSPYFWFCGKISLVFLRAILKVNLCLMISMIMIYDNDFRIDYRYSLLSNIPYFHLLK